MVGCLPPFSFRIIECSPPKKNKFRGMDFSMPQLFSNLNYSLGNRLRQIKNTTGAIKHKGK